MRVRVSGRVSGRVSVRVGGREGVRDGLEWIWMGQGGGVGVALRCVPKAGWDGTEREGVRMMWGGKGRGGRRYADMRDSELRCRTIFVLFFGFLWENGG